MLRIETQALPNPSSAPFLTDTAIPTSTAILSLTLEPTPFPVGVQPPLPDLLLSLVSNRIPLFSCVNAISPGQVWFSEYPYESATVLLSDSEKGFYEPVWSPDGQWIAYLTLDIQNVEGTTQANGTWRQYQDSVWIMRDDGSESQLISGQWPRLEFSSTENSSCAVTQGITEIVGWSADNQWIIFSYLRSDPVSTTVLYAVNIETSETRIVAEGVTSASLWSDNSKIALVTLNPRELKILTFGAPDFHILSLPLAQQLPTDYQLYAVQPDKSGENLLVIGADRESSYTAPATLWQVNIATGEWLNVVDLGDRNGLHFDTKGELGLVCSSMDGQRRIEIFDTLTWNIMGTVGELSNVWCGAVFRLHDGNGNEVVSFVELTDRKSIWVSSVWGNRPVPEKFIDGMLLSFPEGYEIADYAWLP